MRKFAFATNCAAVLLLSAVPTFAGLFDGKGVDIGPIHIDPTNPVAPVTPKGTQVPNPVPPTAVDQVLGESAKTAQQAAGAATEIAKRAASRSEEHTSELQSRAYISYAVFCL